MTDGTESPLVLYDDSLDKIFEVHNSFDIVFTVNLRFRIRYMSVTVVAYIIVCGIIVFITFFVQNPY